MVENTHNKIAQYVLDATRSRYLQRAEPTGFKKGTTKANHEGLHGIAIGRSNVYDVHITMDYYPVQTSDCQEGRGDISCTCMEFKLKNPEGTLAFKLDPCKHILSLAQRWLKKEEIDTKVETTPKQVVVREKYIELPNPTWVEQETPKAYLAKIGGKKKWWPKGYVKLEDTVTYVALWLAEQEGVKGKQVMI